MQVLKSALGWGTSKLTAVFILFLHTGYLSSQRISLWEQTVLAFLRTEEVSSEVSLQQGNWQGLSCLLGVGTVLIGLLVHWPYSLRQRIKILTLDFANSLPSHIGHLDLEGFQNLLIFVSTKTPWKTEPVHDCGDCQWWFQQDQSPPEWLWVPSLVPASRSPALLTLCLPSYSKQIALLLWPQCHPL